MAMRSFARAALPCLALAGLLAGARAPVEARAIWASGTFVYADLCTVPESGERAGRRVTLKRSPNGDALIYEAALRGPVAAGALAFEDEGKTIAFTIETGSGPIAFRGTLSNEEMAGILDDAEGSRPVRLRRALRPQGGEACPEPRR